MDPLLHLPREIIDGFGAAPTVDGKIAVLRSHYEVEEVPPDHRPEDETCYLIVGFRKSHLVRTGSPAVVDRQVRFRSGANGAAMEPVALDRFVAAIGQHRVFVVRRKADGFTERDRILDIGAFGQLIEAAQRSGIVPDVATIVSIRDCEFRLGRHTQAMNLMESLFQGFLARASQRAQRLAREETDIASGRLRISPKELQAKRLRDQRQTQSIERTRSRFARVVEGLRTIVHRGM